MRLIDIIRNNPAGDYFFDTGTTRFFWNQERTVRQLYTIHDEADRVRVKKIIGLVKKQEILNHYSGSFLPNMFIATAIYSGAVNWIIFGEVVRLVNRVIIKHHVRKTEKADLELKTKIYDEAIKDTGEEGFEDKVVIY